MNLVLCLLCIMLVPLASAGLALINQGLGRSRSAAHAMLANLCVLAVSAIVFVVVGASFAGFPAGASHSFTVAGVHWDWLGAEQLFARGMHLDGSPSSLVLCLQIFTAGLAAMIPVSANTDRWRLAPICFSAALFAGFVYPLFSHWVWGGGWLSQLDTNFGIPAFVDAGGAGVIQVTGGFMALSVAWIIGTRRGKYSEDGAASAIPGHNIVLVLFGCLLAFVGWVALDSATSILFYHLAPEQIVGVIINAMLSASAGCLTAVVATQLHFRKPDASLSANGWIAGLVAGSAGCAFVSPLASILTGIAAGALITFMAEIFELHLYIDDPSGAISVHAAAGIWGLIAVGIFGHFPAIFRAGLLLSQIIGVATLLGFMLPAIHVGNLILNRFVPYRVDRDGDWQGMDIRELGAGAYPEFVVHDDEFMAP
jgi:ammonium transporter, Amt family